MDPYYQRDGITIYHGDCREVLPTIGRFDLLLTDPPYGIGAGDMNLGAHNRLEKSSWDVQPSPKVLHSCRTRVDHSVMWGGNYFSLPPSRCFLIWDKTPEMQGKSFAECEMAWCSWDGVARIFRYAPTQMKKSHPTQKPLPLMQWCLTMAPEAQTVLDPFLGSGTTLEACKLAGIQGTGIEQSERYCEIAAKRLEQQVFDFTE